MKKIVFILFSFSFFQNVISQENSISITDSLKLKTFEELEKSFEFNEYDNPKLAEIYATTYLNKGKIEKDTVKIVTAFKYISYLKSELDAIAYSDSIINYSKNIIHKSYPAIGYYQKGAWLYNMGENKEALNNFLIALDYAKKRNNKVLLIDISLAIAALKDDYGEYRESLDIYLNYLNYLKDQKDYKKNFKEDYLLCLYNIGNSYLRLKKPDSANIYINRGIFESLYQNDSIYYYDFLSASGFSAYYKKDYLLAIDSLNKSLPFRNDYGKSVCLYYKAKCFEKLGKKEKAIIYYKKTDSLYQKTKIAFPELRQVYESLLDDAKSNNNVDNQLLYIERLLETDSILNNEFKYISKSIIKKYDVSIILDDKEKIINSLNKETQASYNIIYSLIFILVFSITGLIIYLKYRDKLYKKRFEKLISESENLKSPQGEIISKGNDKKIADDVTSVILKRLEKFEKNRKYLEQGITLSKVAESLKTNSSYLSKVVNSFKEKTFNQYINDLRIDYVVEKLKVDDKFRKYTIKSISEEVGYSTPQSFSSAFMKKTGIKPSYFIKQLKNTSS